MKPEREKIVFCLELHCGLG